MNQQQFLDALISALEYMSNADDLWEGTPIHSVRTFDELGVLSSTQGLVVRLSDGTEFQLSMVPRS